MCSTRLSFPLFREIFCSRHLERFWVKRWSGGGVMRDAQMSGRSYGSEKKETRLVSSTKTATPAFPSPPPSALSSPRPSYPPIQSSRFLMGVVCLILSAWIPSRISATSEIWRFNDAYKPHLIPCSSSAAVATRALGSPQLRHKISLTSCSCCVKISKIVPSQIANAVRCKPTDCVVQY